VNVAFDTMRCDDVQRSVHPYLDGELIENDVVAFDAHVQGCAACRHLVEDEARFKATLRAHLRPTPAAPAELRTRVLAGLDQADAAGDGPTVPIYRRVIPFAAVFAAAASMVVFLSSVVQPRAGRTALVEDAIRSHEKHLPVEVGGDAEHVTNWMQGKVAVPVRPPQLTRQSRAGAENAALVGGRIGHLSSREAAQLTYRIGLNSVTVYVFDPSNLQWNAPKRRIVDDHELFVDSERGYSVVFFRDRGIGYAFTSDLDEDQLVALVSATLE
jgi:anti-sigma factor (TIGR02949 family)